jgi:hypothetical protein
MSRFFVFVILINVINICNVYSLSSDNYIIQSSNYNQRHRTKIYLGQIWDESQIDDNLIKVDVYETWSGYKNVFIYYYENIKIVVSQVMSNISCKIIVDISIIGKKYATSDEITVGNHMEDVISIYGKPTITLTSGELIYFSYRINDPYSDWGSETRLYDLCFIFRDDVIIEIVVQYVHNI